MSSSAHQRCVSVTVNVTHHFTLQQHQRTQSSTIQNRQFHTVVNIINGPFYEFVIVTHVYNDTELCYIYIGMFSSLSWVRLVLWVSPNSNISLCTSSEKQYCANNHHHVIISSRPGCRWCCACDSDRTETYPTVFRCWVPSDGRWMPRATAARASSSSPHLPSLPASWLQDVRWRCGTDGLSREAAGFWDPMHQHNTQLWGQEWQY